MTIRLSYSSVSKFQNCPQAWKLHYIDRIPSKVGEAAKRGTRIHASIEKYINNEIPLELLTPELWRSRRKLEELHKEKPQAEQSIMLTGKWEPCDDKHPDYAWLAIVDVLHVKGDVATVIDLKTGRPYPGHVAQLMLYATAVMSAMPTIQTAEVSALYLDEGRYDNTSVYRRAMLAPLQEYWTLAREKVLAEKKFAPTPSPDACRFCSFAQSKGGPCDKEFVYSRKEKAE